MTVNVKKGDRVRVVLEGEVTHIGECSDTFNVGDGPYRNTIDPRTTHVVSVEVLAKQFKVGDTVEGKEDYAALPVGAIVRYDSYTRIKLPNDAGWADVTNGQVDPYIWSPRTIVFLP